MIRTVTGDIAHFEGRMLTHEHLQIDLSARKGPGVVIGPDDEANVISDLAAAGTMGLGAIADLSVPGSGRAPQVLERISRSSGIKVICATGFYWDPYPDEAVEMDQDQMRERMIGEIRDGIGGSQVRAGVIKVGTHKDGFDPTTERIFAAAVQAATATGAAIITHISSQDQVWPQIAKLRDLGADLSRVVISHMGDAENVKDLVRLAKIGVTMGIDKIGFSKGSSPDQLADLVAAACEAGLAGQMFLSSDMARHARLLAHGGTSYGTVFGSFLPMLRQRGLSESVIDQMTIDSPQRIFTITDPVV